jgi:hypothetical protein
MRWGLVVLAALVVALGVRRALLRPGLTLQVATPAAVAPLPTSTEGIAPTPAPTPAEKSDSAAAVTKVLDATASGGERRLALHQLVVRGINARDDLTIIAASSWPDTDSHKQMKFERGLRITAIEALDKMAATDGAGTTPYLHQVLSQQKDPSLKMLAQVSLTGVAEGKPGKLSRFIDKMLKSP